MSSHRSTVVDLGDHYAEKGAQAERAAIIDWLQALQQELQKEQVVPDDTPDAEAAGVFLEAERRGANSVLTVLIEKMRERSAG